LPQPAFFLLGLPALTVLVLATGCGSTKTVTKTVTVSRTAKTDVGSPRQVVEYGYIKSLKPRGGAYRMRFDPAWLLTGKTANQAALEDTGSSDVPNDNYVVEEGHRLLTYLVPATADITVLSRTGELPGAGFPSTAITASQLAQLVDGQEPVKLAEPLESGFWMHVKIDTVCSLQQQYRP
jgi:hypothetical protein